MNAPSRPIMIIAGGTGGHVFPGLAVAEELQRQGVPVVWLGTRQGLEARVVPAAGIPIEWLNARGLRRRGLRSWLTAPWMIAHSTWQALRIMRRYRPRAVLGMGGYVSGPGAAAARLLGIPMLIHEQNAVPGFTNRKLAPLAARIMTGFAGVLDEPGKTVHTGNPVRAAISAVSPPAGGAPDDRPLRLLVLGGSQGAAAINEAVPAALAQLESKLRPEVRHQAGGPHAESTRALYRKFGVDARVEPFIDDMAAAYAWADLAICRSGALTVAELAAAGVPAVLSPFPFAADDHQTANARHLVARDAGVLFPQDHLTAERLAAVLAELLGDREHLQTMAANARAMGLPDAAARVAQLCLEVAR
jgi:UDP-N-acetylglucosamine--N-acetylmuramyl-(pentapeptide) pyrophosphoryl-undecaprenol N-acetylglucosamine transferase